MIAVNAMTEPGSGSDAFSMKTKAVPDGDGYRITGTKTFSSNGPVADLALAYAMTFRLGAEMEKAHAAVAAEHPEGAEVVT